MTAAVMVIGIALMIVIHEGGHFVAAKHFDMKVTEAFFGFGPKIWSTQRGETEYGLKAIPFGGYVRIIGMNPLEEITPDEEERTYRAAPFWQKSIVVLAGVFSHLIVAFLLFFVIFAIWGQRAENEVGAPIPTLTLGVVAETTPRGEPAPARLAGFEAGDVVTSFEGEPVDSWNGFVDLIRENAGDTVLVGYEREAALSEASVTLAFIDAPLIVDDEVVVDEEGRTVTEEVGYFGAAPEVERVDAGLFANVAASGKSVVGAIGNSFRGLWAMITGFPRLLLAVAGDDDEILQEVRPITPIGLARLAGPLEGTLAILALVNVFVAIINVIPLYPLDGGHFSVAVYEKITGREPDVSKLTPVAAVVILFLVSIGLVGLYLDIFKPLQL
jgi:membrane-associated protease RseP (regulator of RpoE activity)